MCFLASMLSACGRGVGASGSPSAQASSTSLGTLTSGDVALIRANRTLLSTSPYASVTAIRAPGEQVFATVLQDMGFGSRTPTLRTHELLVVRSDTDVPQSTQHSSYGSPA